MTAETEERAPMPTEEEIAVLGDTGRGFSDYWPEIIDDEYLVDYGGVLTQHEMKPWVTE